MPKENRRKLSQSKEKQQSCQMISNCSRRRSSHLCQHKKKSLASIPVDEGQEKLTLEQQTTDAECDKKYFFERLGAKENITEYLSLDLCEKMHEFKEKVAEVLLKPSTASESFLTNVIRRVCTVMHTNTNQVWSGSNWLLVANGNSTLTYWDLTPTSSERCYVFGISVNGTWKYLTHQGEGNPVKFITNSTPPENIDTDNGAEKTDSRTFYLRREGYILAASNTNLALQLSGSIVVANPITDSTDTWQLLHL